MARKQLTLKQAEAELKKYGETYRDYVKAQVAKAKAKTKKDKAEFQTEMDALRDGYTAYRTALRDFYAQGGKRRSSKPKASKPKATTAKKSSTKKSTGKRGANSRRASKVKEGQLTPEQLERVQNGERSTDLVPEITEPAA